MDAPIDETRQLAALDPTELAPIPSILTDAIADLYSVFSRYSAWSKSQNGSGPSPEAMFCKQLTELSAIDLNEYCASGLLSWGYVDDFRHFLPRLFELSTANKWVGNFFSVEFVFMKLTYADWRSWPKEEQAAVEKFLDSWWKGTLASFPCARQLHEVLGALACVNPDLNSYLLEWSSLSTPEAFRHFIESSHFLEMKQCSGWLSKTQAMQMGEWLLSEPTLRWLEDGYCKFMEEPWSSELSLEVDRIDLLNAYRNTRR